MKRIKMTPELVKMLGRYETMLSEAEDIFYNAIDDLETKMEQETSIKGIGFFWCDNSIVGIGTPHCPENMSLIQRRNLR